MNSTTVLWVGMTFLGFMRIAQAVSHGVGVVYESSTDGSAEPQEALCKALGGVVTAPYEGLEDAV